MKTELERKSIEAKTETDRYVEIWRRVGGCERERVGES